MCYPRALQYHKIFSKQHLGITKYLYYQQSTYMSNKMSYRQSYLETDQCDTVYAVIFEWLIF